MKRFITLILFITISLLCYSYSIVDFTCNTFIKSDFFEVNGAPTISRKSPTTSSTYTVNKNVSVKFIVTVYEPDGGNDFSKVEWYIDGGLIKTNQYSSISWSNPHDDPFDYTFPTAKNYSVSAKVYDKANQTGTISWTVTVTDPNAVPILRVDPSSSSAKNFGSVCVGSCSDYSTMYTVYNDGAGAMTVTVSESSSDFDIESGSNSFVLNGGQSKQVRGRFCPQSAGAKSTSLTFTATGATNSPQTRTIQGTGVSPILRVDPSSSSAKISGISV
jgi:hypothetical protein